MVKKKPLFSPYFQEKTNRIKNIGFEGLDQIFPEDIVETMAPYWQRELSRLTNLAPEMDIVIGSLKNSLQFLE